MRKLIHRNESFIHTTSSIYDERPRSTHARRAACTVGSSARAWKAKVNTKMATRVLGHSSPSSSRSFVSIKHQHSTLFFSWLIFHAPKGGNTSTHPPSIEGSEGGGFLHCKEKRSVSVWHIASLRRRRLTAPLYTLNKNRPSHHTATATI